MNKKKQVDLFVLLNSVIINGQSNYKQEEYRISNFQFSIEKLAVSDRS